MRSVVDTPSYSRFDMFTKMTCWSRCACSTIKIYFASSLISLHYLLNSETCLNFSGIFLVILTGTTLNGLHHFQIMLQLMICYAPLFFQMKICMFIYTYFLWVWPETGVAQYTFPWGGLGPLDVQIKCSLGSFLRV